jgi:hypothetical protein
MCGAQFDFELNVLSLEWERNVVLGFRTTDKYLCSMGILCYVSLEPQPIKDTKDEDMHRSSFILGQPELLLIENMG